MHVIVCGCICMLCACLWVWEFMDEILLRGEECKTREIFNFSGKMVKIINIAIMV